jgi:hypothetical protein
MFDSPVSTAKHFGRGTICSAPVKANDVERVVLDVDVVTVDPLA